MPLSAGKSGPDMIDYNSTAVSLVLGKSMKIGITGELQ
jgi:hypothetical protein